VETIYPILSNRKTALSSITNQRPILATALASQGRALPLLLVLAPSDEVLLHGNEACPTPVKLPFSTHRATFPSTSSLRSPSLRRTVSSSHIHTHKNRNSRGIHELSTAKP
jgi:hypothetical protein